MQVPGQDSVNCMAQLMKEAHDARSSLSPGTSNKPCPRNTLDQVHLRYPASLGDPHPKVQLKKSAHQWQVQTSRRPLSI